MPEMRGVKIKLTPTPEQAKVMDKWRRASISLWNLLIGIERAAYDGSKFRPELRWRQIWEQVSREGYENSVYVWKHGKKTKAGVEKKTRSTSRRTRTGEFGMLACSLISALSTEDSTSLRGKEKAGPRFLVAFAFLMISVIRQ
jgi:hypothetical protein